MDSKDLLDYAIEQMLKHKINILKISDIELQKAYFETSGKDETPTRTLDEIAAEEDDLLFQSGARVGVLKG